MIGTLGLSCRAFLMIDSSGSGFSSLTGFETSPKMMRSKSSSEERAFMAAASENTWRTVQCNFSIASV